MPWNYINQQRGARTNPAYLVVFLIVFFAGALDLSAADVSLTWNSNTEPDLAGYKVYYGTASHSYGSPVVLGKQTTYTVTGLGSGTYFFVVSAYDTSGNESGPSNEVSKIIAGTPPPPVAGGLVAAYGFNEGVGSQVADLSGNSNSGTLSGGVSWTTGKYGSGLVFSGNSSYVTIKNSPSLDISGSGLTVEMWVKVTDSTGPDYCLLGKPWNTGSLVSPYYQYGLEFDTNGTKTFGLSFGDSTGALHGPFSFQPPLGTWNHLAFTYDGSFVKGYLNGVQHISVAQSGSLIQRGTDLLLGADPTLNQGYKGVMDEVRIYNRALTQAEVQSDMNTPVSPVSSPKCDLNGDTAVNALDLQILSNAILAGNNSSSYDINHDGSVNALDLQVLSNVILGVGVCP